MWGKSRIALFLCSCRSFYHERCSWFQIAVWQLHSGVIAIRGAGIRLVLGSVMGIVMKKMMMLLATALAIISGSALTGPALAADMPVKAIAPPPPAPFNPWDFAFGSGIMNDYIFRGITQSDHKPSVAAYFEPRYNVNKDLQLYIGTSAESISFPNRAAAEVDIYGGIRPTFGMFAFDFGVWGYLYPGGQCFGGLNATFPITNSCAFGRQWFGTSDAFYGTTTGTVFGGPFPNGIAEPSYNTWNIGVGFTYKVFTLDLRYYDTNLSRGNCNAFTSDYSTTSFSTANITAINPGGFGSNWCSAVGVAKLSADLTAITNLK